MVISVFVLLYVLSDDSKILIAIMYADIRLRKHVDNIYHYQEKEL